MERNAFPLVRVLGTAIIYRAVSLSREKSFNEDRVGAETLQSDDSRGIIN